MSEKNTGGPAFPRTALDRTGTNPGQRGMTLRDWFAGMALAGLLSAGATADDEKPAFSVRLAYRYADAMLMERAK